MTFFNHSLLLLFVFTALTLSPWHAMMYCSSYVIMAKLFSQRSPYADTHRSPEK